MSEPKQKPDKSKQDYGTPWELIRAVESRWGKLDVDLAARADNAKASRFVTPEEDSLKISWLDLFGGPYEGVTNRGNGKLCWLNPEFADLSTWAKKCFLSTRLVTSPRIILLTPASVGSNWFSDSVHGWAQVHALSPRITFEGTKDPYPKDCMLSLFGFGTDISFNVWRWK